ncbi:MAG: hypothetical protein KGL35_07470, partial [Bradyrhizobium sp.]|nr:hypothetical protein [Bradyrhizobium sp.]
YLDTDAQWTANTSYALGTTSIPSAAYKAAHGDPGYFFRVTTAANLATWTANATHALNDIVIPTVPNGFQYKVIATTGATIQSGAIEPAWPTTAGAEVIEIRDPTSQIAPTTYVPPPITPLGPYWGTQYPGGGSIKIFRP